MGRHHKHFVKQSLKPGFRRGHDNNTVDWDKVSLMMKAFEIEDALIEQEVNNSLDDLTAAQLGIKPSGGLGCSDIEIHKIRRLLRSMLCTTEIDEITQHLRVIEGIGKKIASRLRVVK